VHCWSEAVSTLFHFVSLSVADHRRACFWLFVAASQAATDVRCSWSTTHALIGQLCS